MMHPGDGCCMAGTWEQEGEKRGRSIKQMRESGAEVWGSCGNQCRWFQSF